EAVGRLLDRARPGHAEHHAAGEERAERECEREGEHAGEHAAPRRGPGPAPRRGPGRGRLPESVDGGHLLAAVVEGAHASWDALWRASMISFSMRLRRLAAFSRMAKKARTRRAMEPSCGQ